MAVLWFDLMFDVQTRRLRGAAPADAERTLASIAGYYRRVTTDAFPMNRLIALVMIVGLAAVGYELATAPPPRWPTALALLLAAAAIGLAGVRVVPNAVRLGSRADPPETQAVLAHAIYRDHVVCLILIVAFVALQLLA